MKKTLIIGATPNTDRYAYKAAHMLTAKGHAIINIGIKHGEVAGIKIEKAEKPYIDIDTITLYIGPELQKDYYDYILATKPKRVIFNPGTENLELEKMLDLHGIEPVEACTLVLLSTGQYWQRNCNVKYIRFIPPSVTIPEKGRGISATVGASWPGHYKTQRSSPHLYNFLS